MVYIVRKALSATTIADASLFQSDFLDNGEYGNAARAIHRRKGLDLIFQKHRFLRRVCFPLVTREFGTLLRPRTSAHVVFRSLHAAYGYQIGVFLRIFSASPFSLHPHEQHTVDSRQ